MPGRQLSALLAAAGPERIAVTEALTIARDLARALFFLHQLRDEHGRSFQFVHGGLTPAKIVVGFDGVTRLAGLERLAATSGVPLPDRDYAAPEQVAAPDRQDPRSDIFALGAVLLRMITGLRLSDGAIPVPSSADLPHCPGSLEPVLRKALARDPARRYVTAEELRAVLEGFAVRDGRSLDSLEVGKLVRRLLPETRNEPEGRVIPPRPDRSMWRHEASRWAPVDSRLDLGTGGVAGLARGGAPSAAQPAPSQAAPVARGPSRVRVAEPNPLVPAAAAGATTLAVAALDADGEPMLSADAAAVLDELSADRGSGPVPVQHHGPGGMLAQPPLGAPATGYMPAAAPYPAPFARPPSATAPRPRDHRPDPASAPYPAPRLAGAPGRAPLDPAAPSLDRWRWLPTRSLAGTIALLLLVFAAAVAIAYVASG